MENASNENKTCPNCNKTIKSTWMICPFCKQKLQEDVSNANLKTAETPQSTRNESLNQNAPQEKRKGKGRIIAIVGVLIVLVIIAVVVPYGKIGLGSGELDELYDARDGQKYRTVKIGDQIWMAENLNYVYNHGSAVSMCYKNDPENCRKYGRLYTWAAAMDSAGYFNGDGKGCGEGVECGVHESVQGVCPDGWHLPSKEEIEELVKTASGVQGAEYEFMWYKAGTALKSTTGWIDYEGKSGNGTDSLGFGALPAGGYDSDVGRFSDEGGSAGFWSSTERSSSGAYSLGLYNSLEEVFLFGLVKSNGISVRCVKNSNKERGASLARPSGAGAASTQNLGSMTDTRNFETYKTVKMPDGKLWLAENLRFPAKSSWCYENSEKNCEKYGRLYDWQTAKTVCPEGWHLPSFGEFDALINAVGGYSKAGHVMKSRSGWNDDNGLDSYGFSVLPGGVRLKNGFFSDVGDLAYFWTSSQDEYGINGILFGRVEESLDDVGVDGMEAGSGKSVRCVKN